jgi:hypothetical protein
LPSTISCSPIVSPQVETVVSLQDFGQQFDRVRQEERHVFRTVVHSCHTICLQLQHTVDSDAVADEVCDVAFTAVCVHVAATALGKRAVIPVAVWRLMVCQHARHFILRQTRRTFSNSQHPAKVLLHLIACHCLETVSHGTVLPVWWMFPMLWMRD